MESCFYILLTMLKIGLHCDCFWFLRHFSEQSFRRILLGGMKTGFSWQHCFFALSHAQLFSACKHSRNADSNCEMGLTFQRGNNAVLFLTNDGESINYYPVGIYMFKVNNRNSRTRCEICSHLTLFPHKESHFHVPFTI